MLREYVTSERFIHDGLITKSQAVVNRAAHLWKNGEVISAHAIAWPTETVRSDDGKPIDQAVILHLPEKGRWMEAMKQLVQRTKAYGLLFLEPREKELHAIFESLHGSRAWKVPFERRGDRLALGDQKTKDDVECVGLLWSPKRGTS